MDVIDDSKPTEFETDPTFHLLQFNFTDGSTLTKVATSYVVHDRLITFMPLSDNVVTHVINFDNVLSFTSSQLEFDDLEDDDE